MYFLGLKTPPNLNLKPQLSGPNFGLISWASCKYQFIVQVKTSSTPIFI